MTQKEAYTSTQLDELILATLKDEFENIEISEFAVVKDTDSDGDEILRIKVVFDSENQALNTRKRMSLLRHLRPKLEKIGQSALPIFSFIAASEAGG
jgi:hypothetical protein